MLRNVLAFLCCASLLASPALGSPKGKRRSAGSELMEREVARGKEILEGGVFEKILGDPYLVAAMYYSHSYFAKLNNRWRKGGLQDRIMMKLQPLLESRLKDLYIGELEKLEALGPEDQEPERLVLPLREYELRRCPYRCHQDAIDLFAEEGSSVSSIASGIVVLAEYGWRPDERFSTVSNKGGNEVIVFSPATKRFYRYCHLGQLLVQTRDVVRAGAVLGTVGHSGLNASKRGRGKHLHLEINQYDFSTHSTRPLSRQKLSELLKNIRGN